MDVPEWSYEEHCKFANSSDAPKGAIVHSGNTCKNWYMPESDCTSMSEHRQFLRDLKAGTPRAQAYLAEIIAWRMNREQL